MVLPERYRKAAAIVIHLNINGLGTVRALGRMGVPVIAITSGTNGPSEYTRSCHKIICKDLGTDENALIECLLKIGMELQDKAVVFPSGDLYLAAVSEHRELLSQYFLLPIAEKEVVRLILSKTEFYRFAIEHKLPIAKTFFPGTLDDVKQIAERIAYPCLIKPSVASKTWRQHGLKVITVYNGKDLVSQYESASRIHHEFIIQEVTPGPDSALYFSLTYYDQASRPLAMFTGQKLRQFVPRYGVSSMAISAWNPVVAEQTNVVLKALRFQGYGSVEFKRHPVTGEYLMTEVTGRTWYPHALSERCGLNLEYLTYKHMRGETIDDIPRDFEEHVKWIDEVGDYLSARQYWQEGELSLREWIRSYSGEKCWAIFARDDWKPGIRLTIQVAVDLVKVLLRPVYRLIKGILLGHAGSRRST